jgi:alkylation response protein AidB-like acyl-CoA dehydrogenase
MHDVLPHDAVRDELEAMRRLPPALAEAIARAGLLQLYLPRALGGPELAPLTAFGVIEELCCLLAGCVIRTGHPMTSDGGYVVALP